MKRAVILALIGLLIASAGAAQTRLDVGPGIIGPISPLYGLEVAWDNAAMGIGIAKPGNVAQERAAEARAAIQRNNSEAAQRAAKNMNSVTKRATSGDTQGLQKAASILQDVMANVPAEAQQSLQTAVENVERARERVHGEASS
ncbi:MAG: hypothetical protein SVW02_00800, partial [Candidatus Nanohaloarchaea archaeon]|nr:hypothetical protein [Candidatus Nanohaloarchaea archaeon]